MNQGSALHLMIDGSLRELLSHELLAEFLIGCAAVIDMEIIDGPSIYNTEDGLTGVVIIAQSHIIVSTHGLGVHLDVFSCGQFDESRVTQYAQSRLGLLWCQPRSLLRAGVADGNLS